LAVRKRVSDMPKGLSNHEIVTLAVFLLNGHSHSVDTEDVAVKANELAPGRFTMWRCPMILGLKFIHKCIIHKCSSQATF